MSKHIHMNNRDHIYIDDTNYVFKNNKRIGHLKQNSNYIHFFDEGSHHRYTVDKNGYLFDNMGQHIGHINRS